MANGKVGERSMGERSNGTPNGEQLSKDRSKAYPRYTLERAEAFARVVFEEGARRCNQDNVAHALKYSNAGNGAFKSLRASVSYFGMIQVEKNNSISLTEEWIDVFKAEDPEITTKARQDAIRRPQLYQQLLEEYKDGQLPPDAKLAQLLHVTPKYGITSRDAANLAAKTFVESLSFAGMLDENRRLQLDSGSEAKGDTSGVVTRSGDSGSQDRVREQPQAQQLSERTVDSDSHTVLIPAGLDRIEVQLRNRKKAYLFVPVPLHARDKERLKRYIDLILDEDDIEEETMETTQGGVASAEIM